jgi:hypothetical protein
MMLFSGLKSGNIRQLTRISTKSSGAYFHFQLQVSVLRSHFYVFSKRNTQYLTLIFYNDHLVRFTSVFSVKFRKELDICDIELFVEFCGL